MAMLDSAIFLKTLRCPACQGEFSLLNGASGAHDILCCSKCGEQFPIIDGIPRLVLPRLRDALLGLRPAADTDGVQVKTALSFGFEWKHFPTMYKQWEQSFRDYMQPHRPDFFLGKRVLDAGCGNGRFAHYAAKYGAEVWAIDLGDAVNVALRNTAEFGSVRVVQADLHCLPFERESFDFIYSLGVLHHLPDPEEAFRNLLRFLKPGGEIQIYLYWQPERQPIKRTLLGVINGVRQITTRLPHPVVHAVAFPAALVAFTLFVWPYKLLKKAPGFQNLAERLPMKQYAAFPFRVCVNDQLDRLSAPIENRYTKQEVENWFRRAELEEVQLAANYGWVGTARKPFNGSSRVVPIGGEDGFRGQ